MQAAQAATQRMEILAAAHYIMAARKHLSEDADTQLGQEGVPSLPGSSAPTPDNLAAHLNALHERLVHHTSIELQRSCVAETAATSARCVQEPFEWMYSRWLLNVCSGACSECVIVCVYIHMLY
jgi:hypothetical protein